MFGKVISRRNLVFAGLAVTLAGCQVIPKSGPVSRPTPTPEPSATALPQDEGRHRIALLVPLSGENGAVGQAISNAATMAILDTNAGNLRITTYDTAGGASAAARRAVADANELILGPLLPENVAAVVAQARPAKIPLVTFANDAGVAASDVFVMGYVPEQSIARTVAYMRGKGASRFAALLPNGDYGTRADQALAAAVQAVGGSYVASERFDRSNTSAVSAASRLSKKGGFDAVLIADGARIAVLAAKELKNGKPVLLGTELWSGDGEFAKNPALRGAVFSAVSDDRFLRYSTAYKSRFGEAPHRLSTLGYDAVLLTLRLTRDWKVGGPFPYKTMRDEGGFIGVDGALRFSDGPVAERMMEVRQAGNGSVEVVSKVPAKF